MKFEMPFALPLFKKKFSYGWFGNANRLLIFFIFHAVFSIPCSVDCNMIANPFFLLLPVDHHVLADNNDKFLEIGIGSFFTVTVSRLSIGVNSWRKSIGGNMRRNVIRVLRWRVNMTLTKRMKLRTGYVQSMTRNTNNSRVPRRLHLCLRQPRYSSSAD